MKTRRKPKPLNLTAAQARHLLTYGRLLVVEACHTQPADHTTQVLHMTDGIRFTTEQNWWLRYPCKPGDVVSCRERFQYTQLEVGRRLFYEADGGQPMEWRPASWMNDWAIRLRPVVESVVCSRVREITDDEAGLSGFDIRYSCPEGRIGNKGGVPAAVQFAADWHRRHSRRGPAYAFDVAWGWFRVLSMKGK